MRTKSGYDTPLHIRVYTVAKRLCERKGVKLKKQLQLKGFCKDSVYMTASPQATTDTHNHVCERGGIIGDIIDTSRPLTHIEALQKQALDTLTQHSQPTRSHLRCCTSLFNLVLDNGHCGGNCFVYCTSHPSHHSCINTSFIM